MLDAVVGSKLAQRLAGRAAADQVVIGDELAQAPVLHQPDRLARGLTHHKRTSR
jgi:hypothetical protein